MDKLKSEVELCKSSLHSKVQSTEWWWDEDWMLEVLKFKCSRWRWRNNKNWWNANSYTMSTSLNTLPRLLLYLNLLLLPLLSLSILHDLQQRDDDVLVVRFPLERSLDAIIQDLSFWLIYPAIHPTKTTLLDLHLKLHLPQCSTSAQSTKSRIHSQPFPFYCKLNFIIILFIHRPLKSHSETGFISILSHHPQSTQ